MIGGNFNYGRNPGWKIPMRPIFNKPKSKEKAKPKSKSGKL